MQIGAAVKGEILDRLKEHDTDTYEHSVRVANLMFEFGDYMKLNNNALSELYVLGLYHDIGKLYVDSDILKKKGKLDNEEYKQILNHTNFGVEILKSRGYSVHFLQAVKSHHENFDGSGYPDRLTYKEIPLYSQLLRIVDSYDAMTNTRSYKGAYSKQQAINEIQRLKGDWYHPIFADIFCKMQKDKG